MDVENLISKAVIRKQKMLLLVNSKQKDEVKKKAVKKKRNTTNDSNDGSVNNATTLNNTADPSTKHTVNLAKWPIYYLDTKKLHSAKIVRLQKQVQELKKRIVLLTELENDEDQLFLKDLLKHVKHIPEHSKHSFRIRAQELAEEFAYSANQGASGDHHMNIESTEYTVMFNNLD